MNSVKQGSQEEAATVLLRGSLEQRVGGVSLASVGHMVGVCMGAGGEAVRACEPRGATVIMGCTC